MVSPLSASPLSSRLPTLHLIPIPSLSSHSYPAPSLQPLLLTILAPLLSETPASSLGPSLSLGIFGSVDYSMDVLYYMAIIHL